MSSKEKEFEVKVIMYKDFAFPEDYPIENIKFDIGTELGINHNIDCDEPDVKLTIEEVKYE